LPPGNTCADAKDVEVFTLARRSTWFVGDRSSTLPGLGKPVCLFVLTMATHLALGLTGGMGFFPLLPWASAPLTLGAIVE
jgi:hypothetical protein